ncbi:MULTISPECIES: primary-amine oxidase [unclassified Nocardioides]|uniref:primary-amine oxidase n=1 Tax=unclassified Nocardioides TaxID=2615069 RepID=UPI0006FEE881|nr:MULTISPECIES: primary-amine oxidase [unclassified Nocardioides]KRA28030.1 tyramine oxidase [Nocardioides sp. Root614]KRA86005.1 tyramine oxidase [Nocardioides sp. Root682]
MTTAEELRAATSATVASHPLDRLTAAEIDAVRETLHAAGIVTADTRFVYVGLEEPHKNVVLSFRGGDVVPRQVRCLLLATDSGTSHDVSVDVAAGAVVRHDVLDAATHGQMPVLDEEFEIIEGILLADPRWLEAMTKRGLAATDVRAVPLSAGVFGHEDEVGVRLVRVLGFHQADPQDLPWAHPVDGVVAYVDLTNKVVTQVIDHQELPVPAERGEWDAEPHRVEPRTTLKPIEITQPEGPSFSVDGDVVTWEKWRFRVGFDAREGLTLHQLSFQDGERERPVVYRASISEMVVPYADPSPVRYWQNYFDAGEYVYARYTNSLKLGCDCLGEIHYFDATLADERGRPRSIENAICMHEEDYGVLWKHTDMFNGMTETRRQRRLVVSFFLTIGNYDYGFYWHLYLDGTIQLECKATGIVFTSAFTDEHGEFTTEIAPGLGAPFHQHLFSARLDMMVDGVDNAVEEIDAVRVPVSDSNPFGNAFSRSVTRLHSEREAQRLNDGSVGRVWHVVNPTVKNRLGQNVGYALHPENLPVMLADDSSSIHQRATFATKNLWVTRYDPAERYAAGDFVNQHPGGAGLPAYAAADRDIDGQDIVLWHTFGLTHFPRPEDWPVMPVDYAGFTLKPQGFFDRNPTLDVPASTSGGHGHCHA